MSDQPIELSGFQEDAQTILELDEAVASQLPVEWPASKINVVKALKTAGIEHKDALAHAETLWGYRPVPDTSTASASPTTPPSFNFNLTQNDPDRMPIKDLVQAIRDGNREPDFLDAARRRVGQRVWVRETGLDTIDVAATLEVVEESADGSEIKTWNGEPVETLDDILEKRAFANPLRPQNKLVKGNPWLKVDEDRRLMVIWARLTNRLTGNEDEATLISELMNSDLNTTVRWPDIVTAFNRAKSGDKPEYQQARSQVYWRKGEQPASGEPFRRTTGGRSYEV